MGCFDVTSLGLILTAIFSVEQAFVRDRDISPYIIEGSTAIDGDFPWQLSFELRVRSGRWYQKCGAALIHEKFALTASHCVHNIRKKNENGTYSAFRITNMRVVAGTHYASPLDADAEIHYIQRIVSPLGFHSVLDLALLELKVAANTTRNDISPIAIANNSEPAVGELCTIVGWGAESGVRPRGSPVLREGRMTIVSTKDCRASGWFIYPQQLCAQGSPRQVTGCVGDSGGPLSCVRKDGTPVLAGVLSRGYKGCGITRPNVFARASVYRHWLRNLTNVLDL